MKNRGNRLKYLGVTRYGRVIWYEQNLELAF